jgi:hypothetical protein
MSYVLYLIPTMIISLNLAQKVDYPCSTAPANCGAGKEFVWCEIVPGDSNTGKYHAKTSTGPNVGVAMHVMHHSTGCNGLKADAGNFMLGSKEENAYEFNTLEKPLLNLLKTPNGCGIIDATELNLSTTDYCNSASKALNSNRNLGNGEGIINFYMGSLNAAKTHCQVDKKADHLGSFSIQFEASDDSRTSLIGTDGRFVTFVDHKQVSRKLKNHLIIL